jgi:hypothetical protein
VALLKRLQALTWTPEFNVVLFAFLLNYPWEFLQVPLFERMAQAPHWEAVKACTGAACGDAAVALFAYWVMAFALRRRAWVLRPNALGVVAFTACGLLATLVIERLALAGHWMRAWAYSPLMPVLPGLGVGLSPALQWLILPPLVLWMVRRQLSASAAST